MFSRENICFRENICSPRENMGFLENICFLRILGLLILRTYDPAHHRTLRDFDVILFIQLNVSHPQTNLLSLVGSLFPYTARLTCKTYLYSRIERKAGRRHSSIANVFETLQTNITKYGITTLIRFHKEKDVMRIFDH